MATHSSILAGQFRGQRSLVDCSPWGRQELDTTELFFCAVLCCAKSLKSCLTLCNPLNCSPPGSSVRGIL